MNNENDAVTRPELTIRIEIDGEEIDFYPLEQVKLSGVEYLLVSDSADGDGEALILKDLSDPGSEEAVYEILEDEALIKALGKIFAEELAGDDIEVI